jgi:CheY-like chemotaxis protein
MGGEVGVISKPGVGSRFWFTARLNKDNTQAAPPPDAPSLPSEERLRQGFAGTRILLAEDEPINREITEMLLQDVDIQVDLAEDGAQAVALASSRDYALILMDMQMPNMDGLEATRRIRQLPGGKDLPIIAMTANAYEEDRRRCINAGMSDFLTKPFKPEQVYDALLKWLTHD